ncbi:MAG: glutamate racemase [Saprospiraceae bacterium]
MASCRPIGIFDSGVGGLTVANAISLLLPNEAIFYIGDTARIPYGNKSKDDIEKFSLEMTKFLLDKDCKAIVIACNTASAYALEAVRNTYPDIPVIAMEPAVKPAIEHSKTGAIGVLATLGTLRSDRYSHLKNKFGQGIQILENPCLGLVDNIEAGKWNDPETVLLLETILKPMMDAHVDHIVLGCTHYPIVIPLIANIMGNNVQLVNPAPAIAKQVYRQLAERNLLCVDANVKENSPKHTVWATGSMLSFNYLLKELLPNSELIHW